ncbi:hypothetical protein [Magnetospirillum sulfuroxidans]|uniref:Uncharacterized protein n=1 Tax=Magnetospirillum sulfuroxidans TaxID=611300 RepID=A0ABS5IC94_9PROT|nr:hypothetical protein [Magnetospirillum sulfuroxidans]MBR9972052.1 hypothetical protein [Magnetospirillum sulfuroxidans]
MFGLKLVDTKKPLIAETRRKSPREVVLEGIGHQLELLKNPKYTVERTRYVKGDDGYGRQMTSRPPKPWFWEFEGKMFLQIKYGSSQVVMLNGKPTIECGKDIASVIKALEAVKSGIEKGVLDDAINEAKARSHRKKD